MKQLYAKYSEFFNSKTLREQIILALTLLALVYFLWMFLVAGPAGKSKQNLKKRYEVAQSELSKITSERTIFLQALTNNPGIRKQKEIDALKGRLVELEEEVETLSAGLISADKLHQVVRDVLSERSKLALLGLVALPPEPLRLNQEDEERVDQSETSEGEEQVSGVTIYKHRVVFRVQGRYVDIYDYLAELEALNWQFYWEQLDYQVDDYPKAIVQLEAYTLSTGKGFIDG